MAGPPTPAATHKPLCRVCGAEAHELGKKTGHHAHISFSLFRCPECRFAFIHPPWSGMSHVYNEDYYAGNSIDPIVDYVFELEAPHQTIRSYEWKGLTDTIASLSSLRRETRWLDYGCGSGGLVHHLRRNRLADAVGFDSGEIPGLTRKLGIPILNGNEIAEHHGEFDVVTMIEVIEHVVDPIAVLRHARRLLKPNGILYLTTGNARPYRDRLLTWRYVIPEIHVGFFEPRSLETALTRAGFRPVYRLRPPGYTDILRFKILKNLGIHTRGLMERAVPWKLVSFLADLRYQVTYHPYGIAVTGSDVTS